MPLPFAAAFTDDELLVMGAAALFITLAICRQWARDAARWGRVIAALRSENHNLRDYASRLAADLAAARRELAGKKHEDTPGGSPGPAPGGPGQAGS